MSEGVTDAVTAAVTDAVTDAVTEAVTDTEDLIGDIIAEVARDRGVAIARDDPIRAVVWLNQVVLRRYLEQTVVPAVAALRAATDEAVAAVEQAGAGQRMALERVVLEDRSALLEAQQARHVAWTAEVQRLIDGQNAALQQVVAQTVTRLREAPPGPAAVAASSPAPPPVRRPWAGVMIGAGLAVTVIAAIAALAMAAGGWPGVAIGVG